MERAVVLGEGDQVDVGDLPPEILARAAVASGTAAAGAPPSEGSASRMAPVIPEASWEEHEKAKIIEALGRTNWNITKAAQLLGMTFRTLQYRLEKFGIKRPT